MVMDGWNGRVAADNILLTIKAQFESRNDLAPLSRGLNFFHQTGRQFEFFILLLFKR